MADLETYEPAFTSHPGTNLAGIPVEQLDLPGPYISYGLPYSRACAKHVKETYNASRVFIIVSRSLSQSIDKLDILIHTIGADKIVGIQKGMALRSRWSEVLSVPLVEAAQVEEVLKTVQ